METIETLNERLIQFYGRADTNEPKYRLVWSDDQLEKRFGHFVDYTESGIFIRAVSEVREVPKYRSYLPSQWILETLVPVPPDSNLFTKMSYEPLWSFGKLDPDWEIIKIILDDVLGKIGKKQAPIKDEEIDPIKTMERIEKLEKYLYENETNLTARLHFKEAVTVPEMKNAQSNSVPGIQADRTSEKVN